MFRDEIDKILLEHTLSDADKIILKKQFVHLLKTRTGAFNSEGVYKSHGKKEDVTDKKIRKRILDMLLAGLLLDWCDANYDFLNLEIKENADGDHDCKISFRVLL